jgi:hypothetical protein
MYALLLLIAMFSSCCRYSRHRARDLTADQPVSISISFKPTTITTSTTIAVTSTEGPWSKTFHGLLRFGGNELLSSDRTSGVKLVPGDGRPNVHAVVRNCHRGTPSSNCGSHPKTLTLIVRTSVNQQTHSLYPSKLFVMPSSQTFNSLHGFQSINKHIAGIGLGVSSLLSNDPPL